MYTADVSPDGQRLATGGLDGKIRIWSVNDIVKFADDSQAPPDESMRRPLASMSRHTGSVTVVRFSPDGKFLASGSDDRILLIWERDEEQKQPVFGSENDREHWNVKRRLVAHDNDIQDIAWAPDCSILVTVGLDRSVIVWNGSTFEKIKRFDVHQSLVKGVIFDPANKYFATASDDRTVRIFRYHKTGDSSFTIEHIVTDPFKGSPLTTYFRRLSWSPDGQHIAAPNATNGPVSSVAIISRGTWNSSVSLIGHDSPTEVVRFNPRLFQASRSTQKDILNTNLAEDTHSGSNTGDNNVDEQKDKEKEKEKEKELPNEQDALKMEEDSTNSKAKKQAGSENIINSESSQSKNEERVDSIVASAGQDKTLAIWSTGKARPILVAYELTSKSITDMSWGPNGDILFLTSLDGSIITLVFEKDELGVAIPLDRNAEQLHKYGVDKDSLEFPESVQQLELEDAARKLKKPKLDTIPTSTALDERVITVGTVEQPQVLSVRKKNSKSLIQTSSTAPGTVGQIPAERKQAFNKTTIKNGRKRVAPTLISSGYSPTKSTPTNVFKLTSFDTSSKTKEEENILTGVEQKISKNSFPMPRLGMHTLIMGVRERNMVKFYNEEDRKSENELADEDEENIPHDYPLTLNAKTTQDKIWTDEASTRYLEVSDVLPDADVILVEFGSLADLYILEIRNGVERALQFDQDALYENPTKLLGYHKGERVINVLLPHVVICAVGSSKCKCWAVATADGCIFLFTTNGRYKLPKISLGHKVVKVVANAEYLVALTETGLLYAWNIDILTCIHNGVSILPILCNEPVDSNRVRISKRVMDIGISSENFDVTVKMINPTTSYTWRYSLGCWTVS